MIQPPHVALLGDSIFDNSAYTRGAPDVVTHLRHELPAGGRATLCAVDGATTSELSTQFNGIPADASHVVIAIGGNDALQNSDLLTLPVRSSAQALQAFADRLDIFEHTYRSAIGDAAALQRCTIVCTVYNGALEPERATIARVGLALFNDVILRTAIDLGVDVVELRSICIEPGDYANPIEPSGQGGLKIARAISRAVRGIPHNGQAHSRVWGR